MEERRERDLRVPLISCSFFVSSITGGILLTFWLLDIKGSQSWFPIFSLILISLPWIFWFLTYIYTFIKPCLWQGGTGGGGVVLRNHAKPASGSAKNINLISPRDPPMNSPTAKRQVQFGAVVVMGGEDGSGGQKRDSRAGDPVDLSVASSCESDRPLNLNVSSSS